jgi:hypothetical protein
MSLRDRRKAAAWIARVAGALSFSGSELVLPYSRHVVASCFMLESCFWVSVYGVANTLKERGEFSRLIFGTYIVLQASYQRRSSDMACTSSVRQSLRRLPGPSLYTSGT